jgi:hypothetical protein
MWDICGFFFSPFIGIAMTTQLDHKDDIALFYFQLHVFKLADAPNCSYY